MTRIWLLAGLALLAAAPAHAAYQTCNGEIIDINDVRCPDGSIPSYQPGDPPAPPPVAGISGGTVQGIVGITGIWHTTMPGIGYRTAVDVPGSYQLTGPVGLAAGDLTIGSNGFYVWNAFRVRTGPWTTGKEPGTISLFDDAGGTVWQAKVTAGLLTIKNDSQSYSGHR